MKLSSQKNDTVTMTNCDREPIHVIEKAQQHGVIIVVNTHTQKVLQASENCITILGKNTKEIVDQELEKTVSNTIAKDLFDKINKKETLYPYHAQFSGEKYLLIPHISETNQLIIDIEPLGKNIDPILFQEELTKILKEIKDTDPIEEMCNQAALLIKNLYGYDRVMMYRFDEQWNGEVVAEAREKELESWLGLHYPATDIPEPARKIFFKQGVRMICDVNHHPAALLPNLDEKINLSKSELRGVSPIHIEYLKNMNVGASLTVAIILNGKLWGLIACHHYSTKFINYHQRQSCKFLAQVFSNKLALRTSNNFLDKIHLSEKIRKELILQLDYISNFDQALSLYKPNFTDIIESTGGAIYNNEKLTLVGKTPTEKQVLKIISKVLSNTEENVFYTQQLTKYYAKASKFAEKASGVLSIRIGNEENYLIWFRPEESTTITWGGNPKKNGSIKDGVEYLHPRKSFEKWTEKISGIAKPWKNYDVEAASNLKESITHILVKKQKDQIKELNESLLDVNKELETFSYSVSHDLKAPLRGIEGYTRILIQKYFDKLDEFGQNALKTILSSAEEMDLLIEDILTYSKVGQNKLNITNYNPKHQIENIIASQNIKLEYPNIQIDIADNLPNIIGDKRMLLQVFSNLISNAVKYSSKEKNPKIEIGFYIHDKNTIYYIKDNGIGFKDDFKNKIFDVFSRFVNGSEFKGSGIGLATVKKAVEKHQGKIWAESILGKGATFYFYVSVSEK
ncbi:ATP-binding protein [Mesonia aestuariivivens]|uniref:histidine kinase n=1 Tax=Mesonia aestuariivivens TaxID=2796128 RepID=A0ABS6W2N0_9FLAO|nr:ATP-binding protein [Mesonia aestuariivivens]MBW2961751.1 GAF domain-containing protein [Mesonia aestuariivivens]